MSEKQLVLQLAEWMQYKHPLVIYRFDIAAGMKLSIGQGVQNKRLHPVRGYPDMFIAQPCDDYAGLFIELKAEGKSPWLKNGELSKNRHVQEQNYYIKRLIDLGYYAAFCTGFDEATECIDNYLTRTGVDDGSLSR